MTRPPIKILGIDPGLRVTGYGVIQQDDDIKVIEAGIIKTFDNQPLNEKLNTIHSQIDDLIKRTKPKVCVLEELYSHYKHPMTAILMGHARGAVVLASARCGLELVSYPAKTVKKSITGNGNASKQQLQRSVCAMLNLGKLLEPVDVTDALALCLTHIRHLKAEVF